MILRNVLSTHTSHTYTGLSRRTDAGRVAASVERQIRETPCTATTESELCPEEKLVQILEQHGLTVRITDDCLDEGISARLESQLNWTDQEESGRKEERPQKNGEVESEWSDGVEMDPSLLLPSMDRRQKKQTRLPAKSARGHSTDRSGCEGRLADREMGRCSKNRGCRCLRCSPSHPLHIAFPSFH
ncbi:hypothetical protein BLNAU_15227 [Blattamonas nauphoetae]|uniref:Uncharacterized protein n=1 Tax=Blattamonas nauphoetae TaxID=2049346 RepID=A0ABQ9XES3_9EUKA|nr:hypothetical protein BLNAU_15227 [Blattamonas nauphoetae]